jgi:phosphoglycolate phosphatase-like HAD superfamily hydrolase
MYTPKGNTHKRKEVKTMLKRENAHFEELLKIGEAYETIKKAHEEKKQTLIDTYGWDSDELKAWYEEKKEMTYPIPQGACKAYRAWQQSLERDADEVEMDDFLWDREVKDFVETLRAAGIESFIYTNSSSALMENLHQLTEEGCTMDGLVKIERKNRWSEEEHIYGIHFTVNA